MNWKVEYAESVQKSVRKLDRQVQRRLREYIEGRLARMDDPRRTGVAMREARYRDLWRYRVGDYRLVAEIDDANIRILDLRIAHRRNVYR